MPVAVGAQRSAPAVMQAGGEGSLTTMFAERERLERTDNLKQKIRSSSYGLGGQDWPAVFRKYDTDGSGELDVGEFTRALKRVGKQAGVGESDLSDLFSQVDADGSGEVDASEFSQFMELTPREMARKKDRDMGGAATQEYIALAKCVLRAAPELSSARVGYLKKGEVVAVTERRGTRLLCNRLRLAGSQSQPFSGWASERALPRDGEEEGTQLLARLDRTEGMFNQYASEREEAAGTQLRLEMLEKDKKWEQLAHQQRAASRRQERAASQPAARARPRSSGALPASGERVGEDEEAMGAAEHRLYGAMAAAVRNPCPPGPNPLSQQLLISIAGLTQALEECMSRGGGQPGDGVAESSLLLKLLEHTPRHMWGRAIEREWPVLRRELQTLSATQPRFSCPLFCLGLEVLRELSEGGCWQIGGVVGRGGGAGGGGGRGDASLAAGAAGQQRAAPHEHRPGAALASAPLPRRQRGQHAPRRQRERERRQLTRRGKKLGPRRSARAAAGPAMGEGCVHLSGRGAAARGPEAAAWRRRRAKDAIAPCMREIKSAVSPRCLALLKQTNSPDPAL